MFHPDMDAGASAALGLQRDLRQAITSGTLELHYQPQIRTDDGRVVRAEALLRWKHPQRGMISPAEFIPIAERSGLIIALGDWVLATAVTQAASWLQKGIRLPLAINLSTYQLRQADLVDRIANLLSVHNVPAGMITLEITESAAMEDAASTLALIESLSKVGVRNTKPLSVILPPCRAGSSHCMVPRVFGMVGRYCECSPTSMLSTPTSKMSSERSMSSSPKLLYRSKRTRP